MGRVGILCLFLMAALGAAAPFVAPYDPRAQYRSSFYHPPSLPRGDCRVQWWVADPEGRRHLFGFEPCQAFLLGTDGLGRDVLSRALYGARWSVVASVGGVSLTVLFGTLVGGVAGLLGGRWDRLLMRLTELVMALPALYLVLAVRKVFPEAISPSQACFVVVGSLAAVGWCSVSRLLRGQVLSLRERDFVYSALAAGATRTRLVLHHILPNLVPFILLQVGLTLPYFLLGEATLSFLGLGIPEPEASWGNMLAQAAGNYTVMRTYWWMLAVPAGCLTATVLAVNLWVEGLRNAAWGGRESTLNRWGGWGRRWLPWGRKQRGA